MYNREKTAYEKLTDIIMMVLPCIGAALLGLLLSMIICHIFHPVIISGESMDPTFSNGEIVRGTPIKNSKDVKCGDIVIYNVHDYKVIKRVVAMGGDSVQIKEGVLYINGLAVDKYPLINETGYICEPVVLEDDEIFCIGDNVNNSYDCRFTGPVRFSQLDYVVKCGDNDGY